jgi:hypothetical protein
MERMPAAIGVTTEDGANGSFPRLTGRVGWMVRRLP